MPVAGYRPPLAERVVFVLKLLFVLAVIFAAGIVMSATAAHEGLQ